MTQRLGVLDGLRGIAVLLVLWHHVWNGMGFPAFALAFIPATGFLGVDLFFFLSGFVIAYPFVRAEATKKWSADHKFETPTWRHFYFRRGIKILPSYWLSIAVVFAIGYASTRVSYGPWADLAAHLAFVQTWIPNEWGALNSVLWTLAVEVQFYCLFPLLWLAFRRWPWMTAFACFSLAILWRLAAYHLSGNIVTFEFWERNVPGYLDVFMAGILSAHIWVNYKPRFAHAYVVGLGAAACTLAMFYAMFVYCVWGGGSSSVWQTVWRTPMALSFAAVALGFMASPAGWQRLLDNRVLRFVAIISYNLYLYQVIVADCLHAPTRPLYAILVVGVSVAIATVVTYTFERPLLRMKHG